MKPQYERTIRMIGEESQMLLTRKRVILFGVGGVGSYAMEALVRAGIGAITLVDSDIVDETNINRQLIATHDTVGRPKVDVAAERIRSIDPDCAVTPIRLFYNASTADSIDLTGYDYAIDAIDSVQGKLNLIRRCHEANVPVISAMGAGNKLDPCAFEIAPIEKTSVCPLARVMRRELKKLGITGTKVVFSKEEPVCRTETPGSISFVPSAMGLVIASAVIRDLIAQA